MGNAILGHYSPSALTDSERAVYRLVGLGLTNEEIAKILFISPLTVRTHVKRIHCKKNIVGRAKLAIESFKEHWITPNRFAAAIEILKYRGIPGIHDEAIKVLEELGVQKSV